MINSSEVVVAMMPYNTRRKLLSLPSLGIHLPMTHSVKTTTRRSPPRSLTAKIERPPAKKLKRSHETTSNLHNSKYALSPPTPPMTYDHTPPLSPDTHFETNEKDPITTKFTNAHLPDLDGVQDEIVEAVIIQLHKTRNRPHLVKELAAILSQSVKAVEQSANPSAIVSSRLSAYIKRPWKTSSPCPITKELETVHPRRTHYYLTYFPRLPISVPTPRDLVPPAIISPSISSDASHCDETETENRRALSPSPEIDLSASEYDDDPDGILFSPTTGTMNPPIYYIPRDNYNNHQFTSPPLEKDEKEFTQTARGVHRHKFDEAPCNGAPSEMENCLNKSSDEDSLFGKPFMFLHSTPYLSSNSFSPVIKSCPVRRNIEESIDLGPVTLTDLDTRSPENIELEEIDGMFDDLKYV